MVNLNVNGAQHQIDVEGDTPLLYVLRDELKLNAAKFGCGLGQCGYCIPGMMMRAHALIEKGGNPTDREIRQHMQANLCRCGTPMRILRAVRRALDQRKTASTSL